jgi:predicted metal-binding membrane protein
MVLFATGYLAAWVAAGTVFVPVALLVPTGLGPLVAGLVLAAAWQVSPFRERAVRGCHRPRPLPPSGWAAERASIRFGLYNGSACTGACWALMLVASLAHTASLVWMAAITAAIAGEKFARRPRKAAKTVGAGIAACAGMLMAVALL